MFPRVCICRHMFVHIHRHTPCSFSHKVITLFPLACMLDVFTWYHIWRLHCSNIISFSTPRTQPVPRRTPDLSLRVWVSSGIAPALNGTPIHPPEYDRNLEIILDISSCRSPVNSVHDPLLLLFTPQKVRPSFISPAPAPSGRRRASSPSGDY